MTTDVGVPAGAFVSDVVDHGPPDVTLYW